MFLQNYDDVGYDLQIRASFTDYEQWKGPLGVINTYFYTTRTMATTQLASNIPCLPLRRYFKYQFK